MTTDKTPATLANVKHGGCVQLPSLTYQKSAWMLPDDARIVGVIADNIERGKLNHPGFYRNTQLAEALRRVLDAALSAQASPGGQGDALLESLVARWRNHAEEIGVSDNLLCQKIANCTMRHAAELQAVLAARQPVCGTCDEAIQPDAMTGTKCACSRLPVASIQPSGKSGELAVDNKPVGCTECPVTRLPFYGNMEHPKLGWIAMYGGPLDVYSVPELQDNDGELRRERYDLDADCWVEGGEPLGYFYSDQQPEAAPPAQAVDLGTGVKAIAAERERQVQAEGFTRDSDRQYQRGELAKAATAYVQLAAMDLAAGGTRDHIAWHGPAAVWPWAPEWWKPVDARRDLVRAGALIAAQIDLIDSQALGNG